MSPQRRIEINGHIIEEFYWAGKMIVYVDNRLFDGTYEQAIEKAR